MSVAGLQASPGRLHPILTALALALMQILGSIAHAQGVTAAQRAVQEAKRYSGITLTLEWQAGLQSLDPLNFSGPLWESLTGIKIKVVEIPLAEVFSKVMLDHRSGGSFDIVDVVPAWLPDLVQAGALEPLDAFVDKFRYRDELKGIAPTFRDNWMTVNGRTYAFADDGDVLDSLLSKRHFRRPCRERRIQSQARLRAGCSRNLETVRRNRQLSD